MRPSGSSLRSTARHEERIGRDLSLLEEAPLTIDIDHHHDDARFGAVTLVVSDAFVDLGPCSATCSRSWKSLILTPEIAEALYIAFVT